MIGIETHQCKLKTKVGIKMLAWQLNLEYVVNHWDEFPLDSFQFLDRQMNGESVQAQVTELVENHPSYKREAWGVFENGHLIGFAVFRKRDAGIAHLILAGVSKKRAWLEFIYVIDSFYQKTAYMVTEEQWQLMKPYCFNSLDVIPFRNSKEAYRLQLKKETKALKIRRSFYQDNNYLSNEPLYIFKGFDEWEVDDLEASIDEIANTYYAMQLERFALTGDRWLVRIHRQKKHRVDNTDEAIEQAKQEWRDKGYKEVVDPSLKPLKGGEFRSWCNSYGQQAELEVYAYEEIELDHKYNDGRLTYYRHVLKRHIMDFYLPQYSAKSVEVLALDRTRLWSQSLESRSKDYGDFICKYPASYLKAKVKNKRIIQSIRQRVWSYFDETVYTGPALSESDQMELNDFLIRALRGIAYQISPEIEAQIFERVFHPLLIEWRDARENKCQANEDAAKQAIHDKSLVYLRFLHSDNEKKVLLYLTPSVLKRWMLELSPHQINQLYFNMDEIYRIGLVKPKEFRKWLYQQTRKHGVEGIEATVNNFLKELKMTQAEKIQAQDRQRTKRWLKEIGTDLQTVEAFLSKMRRYCEQVTFQQFVEQYGIEMVAQAIKGEAECVFEPQTFIPSYQSFGQSIRGLLRGKVLSNPKRFYHQLRQITDVDAIVAGEISSAEGKRILDLFPTFQQNPKEWESLFKLTAKIEPKGSPEFLMAGNASVCCMSFGAGNAITYAKEKAFGVLNLYYGDRVVGNSVLWMNQSGTERFLVLDNIEIHPNYDRIKPFLNEFLMDIVHELKQTYECQYVIQGKSYNDFSLYTDDSLEGCFTEIQPIGCQRLSFYTDAKYFKLVCGEEHLQAEGTPSEKKSELIVEVGEHIQVVKKPVVNPLRITQATFPAPIDEDWDLPF